MAAVSDPFSTAVSLAFLVAVEASGGGRVGAAAASGCDSASWMLALRELLQAFRRLLHAFRQPPGHGVPVVPAMPGSAPERPGIFSMDEEVDEAGMETVAVPGDPAESDGVDEEALEAAAGSGAGARDSENGNDDFPSK